MKKALFALLLGVCLITTASQALAYENFIEWTASDTQDLAGNALNTLNTLFVPIIVCLAIAVGFVIGRKLVGLIKGAVR